MVFRHLHVLLIVLLGSLVLSACEATHVTRGFIPDDELVSEIRVGVDNRTSVGQMLGQPSSVATFDAQIWYYISEKTEQVAFLEPEVLYRKVIQIDFDDEGQVAEIVSYTIEDGEEITYVGRVTPTLGKELSFFQQMFQNIGRFNRPTSQ